MLNQCSTIVECIQQFQTGMAMTRQYFITNHQIENT
jgi:hypothetical protein